VRAINVPSDLILAPLASWRLIIRSLIVLILILILVLSVPVVVVVLVVIDEPKTDVFGGLVAAPAFKEIAAAALPGLGVPPSRGPSLVRRAPEAPKTLPMTPPVQVKGVSTPGETLTERLPPGAVAVPDVQGRVGREAVARLLSLALEPRLLGSGRVVAQSPAPGARVAKGARVTLEMSTAAGD